MKFSKIVLSSASALALALAVGSSSTAAFAQEQNLSENDEKQEAAFAQEQNLSENDENQDGEQDGKIQPRVNWTGTATLSTDTYNNVTASNNWSNDRPRVTNHATNKGNITVKVIAGNGQQIGNIKTILPGKTVQLDTIPAFSGTYTILAIATVSGTYTITVD